MPLGQTPDMTDRGRMMASLKACSASYIDELETAL